MTLVKIETEELNIIEKSKAQQIKKTFEPMVTMLETFEESYNSIIKESEKEITQDLSARAKRLRLDVGKVRIESDKLRIKGNEQSQKEIKARNGVCHILTWAVTDKENNLKGIENHFEIQEKNRLDDLQTKRVELLSKFVDDAHERDLSGMDDDVWSAYFNTKKQNHADKIAAEKKAEEDSIKAEKAKIEEDKRIRAENERLEKEAKAAESKRIAEQKKRDAQAEKERKEYEAKLKTEREAREKIEREEKIKREKLQAELKAKEEAERKEKQRLLDIEQAKIKAEKAALLAPDKDKLLSLSKRIMSIDMPELKSKEANNIMLNVVDLLSKVDSYINEKVESL